MDICQYTGRRNGKRCRNITEYVYCEQHIQELEELYKKNYKGQRIMKYNDVINIYNYDLRDGHGDGILSDDEILIRDYLIDLYLKNSNNKYIGNLTINKIKEKIDSQGCGDIPVSLALSLLEI